MKLNELKELCEKATPGPWESTDNFVEKDGFMDGQRGVVVAELFTSNPMWGDCCNDTAFIAAANPKQILSLIKALEIAQNTLKLYEGISAQGNIKSMSRYSAAAEALADIEGILE